MVRQSALMVVLLVAAVATTFAQETVAQPSDNAFAEKAPTDTVNHFYVGLGGLTALGAPLTLRSTVNTTGAGAGVSYIKDFAPLSSGEFCVMYSVVGRGLLRLSLAMDRVSGNANALLTSDAQIKPVAESASNYTMTSNTVFFGMENDFFASGGLSAYWGGHYGLFIASANRVSSIDYTTSTNQAVTSGQIREGFTRALAPAIAASLGLRYQVTKSVGLELRSQYAMVFGTQYTSTLTLTETLNNVTTVVGQSETSRSIDGLRCGLFVSFRLW